VTEELKSSYEVLGRMKEVTEVGVKGLIRLYFFKKLLRYLYSVSDAFV